MPTTAVLSPEERARYDAPTASGAAYQGEPAVPWPVVPVQVWGLRYALDVVVESRHPDWIMHEYARVDLPAGPLWLAKDAAPDGLQIITADVPDIDGWVPEIPVPRRQGVVTVVDRTTPALADLDLAYTNPAGDPVRLHYRGPLPTTPSKPRNGNTMGHSRQSLAALLDLYLFRPGGEVSLDIGGQRRPVRRLLGLYPMKFVLAQTQGGFAIASFLQGPPTDGGDGFRIERPAPGVADWPTRATEAWTWEADHAWVRRDGPVTTLRHHFVDGELDQAQVWQAGDTTRPIVNVVFRPALPDVRRRFTGETVSRFVVDLNDQPAHGVGEVRCRWEGDAVRVTVLPRAPAWFASRPVESTIHFGPDGARVDAVRIAPTSP